MKRLRKNLRQTCQPTGLSLFILSTQSMHEKTTERHYNPAVLLPAKKSGALSILCSIPFCCSGTSLADLITMNRCFPQSFTDCSDKYIFLSNARTSNMIKTTDKMAEPPSANSPSTITPRIPISGHSNNPENVYKIRFLVMVKMAPLYAFPIDIKMLLVVICREFKKIKPRYVRIIDVPKAMYKSLPLPNNKSIRSANTMQINHTVTPITSPCTREKRMAFFIL